MIPAWLRHLFVAPEPENSRIAAAETAQDRKDGRLYDFIAAEASKANRAPLAYLDGYHRNGCLMRQEAQRHHAECPCECHA